MSRRGIIEQTPPEICDMCGKTDELRPYEANGENICLACAMKDEETTRRRFSQHVLGEDFDA